MSDPRRILVLAAALAACSPAPVGGSNSVAPDNATVSVPQSTNEAEGPAQPDAQDSASAFTELNEVRCPILDENKEEGPYWLRRCTGHAGWQLDWSESDLRQGLSLIAADGKETELSLSDLVAKGAFNSIGKTIEWRGKSAVVPEAMIVRMSVANGVEPQLPDISRLAVVRLTGTPCLVAVIEPGAGQNERARRIADGAMDKCLTA
jgi:hypothetical protein